MEVNIWLYLINVFFALYFIVLIVERVQSLAHCAKKKCLTADGLSVYMTILCVLSLVATVVLYFIRARVSIICIFEPSVTMFQMLNFPLLCLIAGILLLSGMVHTEHTIVGLQFASYGALILSMLCWGILFGNQFENQITFWGTFVYIIAFSMAIPVVYRSKIKHAKLFHVIECFVSVYMVVIFTQMLRLFYSGLPQRTLSILFLIPALIGDAVVIGMRWKEEKNWFVLVSLILALILWILCMFIFPLL